MELQELVERIQRWKRKQTGEFEAASDAPEAAYAYQSGVRDDSAVPMATPHVISSVPEEMAFEDLEEAEETAQAQAYDEEEGPVEEAVDEPVELEREQSEPALDLASELEGEDDAADGTENIDDLDAFRLEDEEQVWSRQNSRADELLPNLEETGSEDDEDDDEEDTR